MVANTVVFTGGGTGGHVYPGIAVLEALRSGFTDAGEIPVAWIGSRTGMERRILSRSDVPYIGIAAGKLRRYVSARNLADIGRILLGALQSLAALSRLRPCVVFSKGGYVSVPPVLAAWMLGIPVVTHESDSDPGLATRINSRFAAHILVSFEDTVPFFSPKLRKRVRVVGNPVRRAFEQGDPDAGREFSGAPKDKRILLVLGGSLGAREINTLVEATLGELVERWHVVHQKGRLPGGPEATGEYRVYDYIYEEFPDVLAAADLVVARAGAATLWELAAAAKPSVLVPLGLDASRGDQIRNAQLMERRGAARVLMHPTPEAFELLISELADDPDTCRLMGRNAYELYQSSAADTIAGILYGYAVKKPMNGVGT